MIKGYKSFQILEKLRELEFLFEGNVEYSDLFKERIYDLKDKSPIAKLIIRLSDEYVKDDKDLKNNYIDVTDKEDKVTFISQVKFNQMQSKSKSYLDPFDVPGRTEIGIGRCIRALSRLGDFKFTDKELEEFVNLYKSKTVSEGEEFQLVKGEDIKYWYNSENYFEDYGIGKLFNSCMKDVDSHYFDIYSESESCNLLILTKKVEDRRLLIGRSLIWKPSEMWLKGDIEWRGSEYFMDRIYCMRDSDEKKFISYADNEGWLVKYLNNSDNYTGMNFKLKGDPINLRIVCDVEGNCDEYPYMDTLKYLSETKDKVSNIGYKNGFELQSSEGEIFVCSFCDGSGVGSCPECNGYAYVPCKNCHLKNKKSCDECGGGGIIDCPKCEGTGQYSNCEDCTGLIERL